MRPYLTRWLPDVSFIAVFLMLDWVSYINALYGLNITPWNPDPALGLAYWMRYGKRAALPWFAAIMLADIGVRGLLAGWFLTAAFSALLTLGYGLIGEVLRRQFAGDKALDRRANLLSWLIVVIVGSVVNGLIYISLLYLAGLIPEGQWATAFQRFAVGDIVGIVGSMPFLWLLLNDHARSRLRLATLRWETAGYVALAALMLWIVFGLVPQAEFKHFYFLFLPIVWAGTRQGLHGAALIAFVVQIGIIVVVKWLPIGDISVVELQMLGAVLALVGFFIGVVVDEQKQAAEDLKNTLRLAAAGEMASALAHELNQPMTALLAYGKACKDLLAKGEQGERLTGAIQKMLDESGRASDVVRRLRDFFRTGAMRMEPIDVDVLIETTAQNWAGKFEQYEVVLNIAGESRVTLHADRLQIELVLRNLLSNALDEVVKQPRAERRITVTKEVLPKGRLAISVEDSGHGVSGRSASHLFEPFVSSKSTGMGLGLVLSRSIVEAHGGALWAETGDHGVFKFVLPLLATGVKIGN